MPISASETEWVRDHWVPHYAVIKFGKHLTTKGVKDASKWHLIGSHDLGLYIAAYLRTLKRDTNNPANEDLEPTTVRDTWYSLKRHMLGSGDI